MWKHSIIYGVNLKSSTKLILSDQIYIYVYICIYRYTYISIDLCLDSSYSSAHQYPSKASKIWKVGGCYLKWMGFFFYFANAQVHWIDWIVATKREKERERENNNNNQKEEQIDRKRMRKKSYPICARRYYWWLLIGTLIWLQYIGFWWRWRIFHAHHPSRVDL